MLVGPETWDDAGVFRLSPTRALVQTVDFLTPVVNDPFDYGRIAAANALSDVYAMGGAPLTALSIVCYPERGDMSVLGDILRGGSDTLAKAGVALLGGHTVRDPEIKFGFAVTGEVHPKRIVTNAGAKRGDLLVLTKPLGTGILATALKRRLLPDAALARMTAQMATLNRAAALAMRATGASAATDVTGFGLLGHALNVARASKKTLRIWSGAVPLLPGVSRVCFTARGVRRGSGGAAPDGAGRPADLGRASDRRVPAAGLGAHAPAHAGQGGGGGHRGDAGPGAKADRSSCVRMGKGERMGSGGLRGLQIPLLGVSDVRGGFDSHTFPPSRDERGLR